MNDTPPDPSPDDPRRPSLTTLEHTPTPRQIATTSSVRDCLGPFEIRKVIGRGGMGVVFAGIHLAERVPVAIKVITNPGSLDDRRRRRLQREVRAVAALNHHGIIRIFDYGVVTGDSEVLDHDGLAGDTPYFVMELLQDGTVNDLIGALGWPQIRSVLLTLLDALAHAHAAGVIHRDIKPDNILLAHSGGRVVPKLADFGISFAIDADAPTAHCVGTPRYMAPEQINQPWRTHGPWSDLYSLGCVGYELICGSPFFDGDDISEIYQQHFRPIPPDLCPVNPVPSGLKAWIDSMVAREPTRRFQSAADAAQALAALGEPAQPEVSVSSTARFAVAPKTPVLDPILGDDQPPTTGRPGPTCANQPAGQDWLATLPDHWPAPEIDALPMRIVGTGLGLYGLRKTPLIGRDDELEYLWDQFRHTIAQQDAGVVVIRGSQGAGKSRLVDAFLTRLQELGAATVLRASHRTDGEPSDGFSRMLERHFRTLGCSDTETTQIIRDALDQVGLDQSHHCQAMSGLARPTLGADVARSSSLGPGSHRYAVLRRYLSRRAHRQPVVVWCDDAQWSSDAFEFGRYLSQSQSDTAGPILVVLTVTDEEVVDQPTADMLEQLIADERVGERILDALGPVHHGRLVHELLRLDGDLARRVIERTAGNPLFAVELIGDWVDRGVLESAEQGFVLRDGVEPTIPNHLHDIWVSRIDALLAHEDDDARGALELAAALGRDVRTDEWRCACNLAGIRVDAGLVDSLVDQRFAERTDFGWVFAHAIVRDSIERVAREHARWSSHRRHCATVMETIYDMRSARTAGRFGRYAKSAGDYDRAAEPLIRAARDRRRRGEFLAAQQFLCSYLQCLDQLGAPTADRRWVQGWICRAYVAINDSRPNDALQWARRARDAATDHHGPNARVQALSVLGLAGQWMGRPDAADHLRQASRMLETLEETDALREAIVMTAHGLTRLSDYRQADVLLDMDLSIARKRDDGLGIANNYHMRFRNAFFQDRWPEALDHIERAVDLFGAIGHLPGKANALEAMAEVYRATDDQQRAKELYRHCIELQDTIGYSTGVAHTNLATILLHQQRPKDAESLYEAAAQRFANSGRRMFQAVARAGLLACAGAQHLWISVDEHLAFVQNFVDDIDACERDLAVLLELGADHLRDAGQFRDAVAVYHLAWQQWRGLGQPRRAAQITHKLSP